MRRTLLPERNLDVLRAVAVLCVLADHLLTAWSRALPFVTNVELGSIGVLLFFVHTALVLMGSLERQGERQDWVRAFYIRRAFRIYPLAIATILGVALFAVPPRSVTGFVSGPPVDPTVPTLIANMALVQNIVGRQDILGVLWSLPIEVQMYLALPLAFVLAKRGVRAVVVGLVALGALGLAVQYLAVPGLWRLSVAKFGPCFLAGVLAYAILRKRLRPIAPGWTWGLVLVACVPLLTGLGWSPETPQGWWLFCLAVACAIPAVRELGDSWITRAAHTVCTYSYGIYLLHFPVIWLSFTVLRNAPLVVEWVTFGVLIVALPTVGYHAIEKPGIRLGQRIVGRPLVPEPAIRGVSAARS